MYWWAQQLTAPLNYLKIRVGKDEKFNPLWVTNFVLPAVGAGAFCVLYVALDQSISLIGEDGLFRHILSLAQILVPFFIAALAAVASMNGTWLDQNLRGSRPTTLNGRQIKRRELVIRMFGYLAYITLLTYLIIVSLIVIGPLLAEAVPFETLVWFKVAILFLVVSVFANIIITTFMSLYFLTDRLHEPND
ncbi:MAG: hypothetical protein AAF437_11995 [Pseudomonadota bacterium]